jgi:primase-polymerase (primpol)-like protein
MKARNAKNGADFIALYDHGDLSAYDGDHSRADQALCNHLAYRTGRDAARIDQLFRSSALMREKWERADYRNWTI